jgi:hypothetical protein
MLHALEVSKLVEGEMSGSWSSRVTNEGDIGTRYRWGLMMMMLMFWDYVSELWLATGLLFITQVIYEHAEP